LCKSQPKRSKKGFVVKVTESRFNEKTLLGGKSPNDIKVFLAWAGVLHLQTTFGKAF